MEDGLALTILPVGSNGGTANPPSGRHRVAAGGSDMQLPSLQG